jgi:AraC-like DNA-binding protein
LYVEETIIGLLARVIEDAYTEAPGSVPRRHLAAEALAHDACELLGRRFTEPMTLAEIAAAIGTSPFHLCRSFRRATGTTLHEYRNQLRLRSALDRLEAADDLSQLALELGYSSHSHFTAAFRRSFGFTPSIARTVIAKPR